MPLLPQFEHICIEEVLSIFGGLIFLIHIIHYFLAYWPAAALKTTLSSPTTSTEPVSVIICARNEDENLTEFLPKILTQEYHEFEVIVVNDCSWDIFGLWGIDNPVHSDSIYRPV